PGFQSNPLEAVGGVPQNLQQGCRFARYLHFLHDLARVIHNADTGLLDRYVQSRKMVHAALLLLMFEAVTTDLVFTISLKRSTKNLQLSTSWAGRLPHLMGWSRRAPAPPAIEAGKGRQRRGARHVSADQRPSCGCWHRYRKKLLTRCRSVYARETMPAEDVG